MSGWNKKQVQLFVREVRKEAGDAWYWMIPRLRVALIAEKAFAVARGQCRDTVAVEAMDRLLGDMLREAGLEE